MTQHFHEGQEVEVLSNAGDGKVVPVWHWRKAKVVRAWLDNDETDTRGVPNRYVVQFPDGVRAVFSEDNIKTAAIEWPQKWAQMGVSP